MGAQTTIHKETVPGDGFEYGIKSVSTSAEQLTTKKLPEGNLKGLLVKAPCTNTTVVYIGGKHVTADQNDTGGYPLDPGNELPFPIASVEHIYVISTDTSQKINWIIL